MLLSVVVVCELIVRLVMLLLHCHFRNVVVRVVYVQQIWRPLVFCDDTWTIRSVPVWVEFNAPPDTI